MGRAALQLIGIFPVRRQAFFSKVPGGALVMWSVVNNVQPIHQVIDSLERNLDLFGGVPSNLTGKRNVIPLHNPMEFQFKVIQRAKD